MLFAYVPNSDTDRVEVLRTFLSLADTGRVPEGARLGHHDGWGMALYARGVLLRHFRTTESGGASGARAKEFFLTATHKPDVLLAHVRKMSVGGLDEQNSHPFTFGRFSFAHNGTLGVGDQPVFDPVRGRTLGETDSEYYFHLIIQDLDAHAENDTAKVKHAIIQTIQSLRMNTLHEGGGFTSASSMLTDGRYAYVLREFDEQHPHLTVADATQYFTLYLGKGPRGERIICSEELNLPEVSWEQLPNHSLTVLDLVTGVVETQRI